MYGKRILMNLEELQVKSIRQFLNFHLAVGTITFVQLIDTCKLINPDKDYRLINEEEQIILKKLFKKDKKDDNNNQ